MVGRGWWRSDRSVRWCWAVGGVEGGRRSHPRVLVSLVGGGCCCGVDGRRRLWREGVALWWEGKLLGWNERKSGFVLMQVCNLERMASRIFFLLNFCLQLGENNGVHNFFFFLNFWIFINKSQSSMHFNHVSQPSLSWHFTATRNREMIDRPIR
jgi:hypothetical protein